MAAINPALVEFNERNTNFWADQKILMDRRIADRAIFETAALPGIPSYAVPTEKTEYEHGYHEGRTPAADRHPSQNENPI